MNGIMDPDSFMEQLKVIRLSGVHGSDESAVIQYRHSDSHSDTIFQVWHLMPAKIKGEQPHEYGINCWCKPETDGYGFLHKRYH